MSELKPCPFCGGEAKQSGEKFERTILSWVYCTSCGAAGGYRGTEAEAIDAWNTRAERTVLDIGVSFAFPGIIRFKLGKKADWPPVVWMERGNERRSYVPKYPELVRCRDCKFYILDEFDEAECHQFTDYYDQPVHWPEPDGFCSYGARREEER